jgi:hypothetical protein
VKSVTYRDYDAQNCIAKAGTGAGRFEADSRYVHQEHRVHPKYDGDLRAEPIAFNSWATLLGSLSKALDVKTRDRIFFNNVFDPEKDFPAVTPAGSI